jgi:pyruvate formate lyase activating enzyme
MSCPHGAVKKGIGYPVLDREICCLCRDYSCRSSCPSGALIVYGERVKAPDIIGRVEKEGVFYNRSGGGLTVSGGEPLKQPDFLMDLLELAKRRRLKTALETAGLAEFAVLNEAAGLADVLLFDIKIVDRRIHEIFTGVDNDLILSNLILLMEKKPPHLTVWVRTPVVPGFNDTPAAARALGRYLARLPAEVRFEALPYHRFGQSKYSILGRHFPMGSLRLADGILEAFEGECLHSMKMAGQVNCTSPDSESDSWSALGNGWERGDDSKRPASSDRQIFSLKL